MSKKVIPVECFSRVVGYFRPIQNWNKGKKAEWAKRKEYDIEKTKKYLTK